MRPKRGGFSHFIWSWRVGVRLTSHPAQVKFFLVALTVSMSPRQVFFSPLPRGEAWSAPLLRPCALALRAVAAARPPVDAERPPPTLMGGVPLSPPRRITHHGGPGQQHSKKRKFVADGVV